WTELNDSILIFLGKTGQSCPHSQDRARVAGGARLNREKAGAPPRNPPGGGLSCQADQAAEEAAFSWPWAPFPPEWRQPWRRAFDGRHRRAVTFHRRNKPGSAAAGGRRA